MQMLVLSPTKIMYKHIKTKPLQTSIFTRVLKVMEVTNQISNPLTQHLQILLSLKSYSLVEYLAPIVAIEVF